MPKAKSKTATVAAALAEKAASSAPTVDKPVEEAKPSKPVRQKVKRPSGPVVGEGEIKYPKPATELAYGDAALTLDRAQDLIGWQEMGEKDDATISELHSLCGLHVRLNRNPSNRWLTPGWLMEMKQEFLNRRWRFNGEAIVIGNHGNVMSGQHRLLGYILAVLETQGIGLKLKKGETKEQRVAHWKEIHPEPLTMETVVVYGVDESDDTFKTLNCGKKGTFAEVLYRSTYFANCSADVRKKRSQMCDWAVKLLWSRTGAEDDPYAPRRTHGEAMDFLAHHLHIIEAVERMSKEYHDKSPLADILTPGSAAAVLYLMASSASDGDEYWNSDPRQEEKPSGARLVNFSRWDDACEFWVGLNTSAGPRSEMADPIRQAISLLDEKDPDTGKVVKRAGLREKLYVLAGAWNYFLSGEEFSAEDLRPKYNYDPKTDKHTLKDVPYFGGIDYPYAAEEDPEETPTPAEESSEERAASLKRAEERAEAERKNRAAEKANIIRMQKRRREAEARGVSVAELPNGEEADMEEQEPEEETER